MSALPTPVTFAEKVYALSKVIHIRKYSNTTALSNRPLAHQKSHLRLLDDIALLLVTEGDSDVAAVSFERTEKEARFYYAKNRLVTAKEKSYIIDLVKILKLPRDDLAEEEKGSDTGGTGDGRVEKLLAKVVSVCGKKIKSRIRKLKRDLPADRSDILRDDLNGEMHAYFEEKFGSWYKKYNGAHEFITKFLHQIDNLDLTRSSTKRLCDLIRVAYRASAYKKNATVLVPEHLARRLRLVGDYFGAVKRIVKTMGSLRSAAGPGGPLPAIIFEEVRTPTFPRLSLPTDYLEILNRCAVEHQHPLIEGDALTVAYPRAAPRFTKPASVMQVVTQSVHAECRVAVHMSGLRKNWKYVEIGVSKGSCWLCEMFLTSHLHPLVFHIRNIHGKLQPGWTLPPSCDAEAQAYMIRLLDEELEEVLMKCHDSMRIDSPVRSGSDSDSDEQTLDISDPAPFWEQ